MSALDYFSDNNNVLKEMPYVKIQIPKKPWFEADGLKVHQKGIDVKYDCDIIALESCKSQSFVKDHANRPFLAHQSFWHR